MVVQAPKLADTIALYDAAVQSGAVYLPLNWAYTQSELTYFIEDAAPALVVCDAFNEADLVAICGDTAPLLTLANNGRGSISTLADCKPTAFETVERGLDDLAAVLSASGTTGRSKGAMLSHRNLLSNGAR